MCETHPYHHHPILLHLPIRTAGNKIGTFVAENFDAKLGKSSVAAAAAAAVPAKERGKEEEEEEEEVSAGGEGEHRALLRHA